MRSEEFINMCQAVVHGSPRFVRHLERLEEGKIVRCEGNRIEVDLGARSENWSGEECEEIEKPQRSRRA